MRLVSGSPLPSSATGYTNLWPVAAGPNIPVVFRPFTNSASSDSYLHRLDIGTMSLVCRRVRKRCEHEHQTSGSTAHISLCYSPSPSETGTGGHTLPPVGGHLLSGECQHSSLLISSSAVTQWLRQCAWPVSTSFWLLLTHTVQVF
jgi:hypothetical protein